MMRKTTTAYFTLLEGSAAEIGRLQALEVKQHPHLRELILLEEELPAPAYEARKRVIEMTNSAWNDELAAFAEELQVPASKLIYYASTSVAAGCSHCAVLPHKTVDQRTYVLRNYDLAPHMDDMRLCSTKMAGAYTHSGFSIYMFGRSEGMNEHGLCVTFSACGQPVGLLPGMREPRAEGLQFWAVVRLLLEQCKTVHQALDIVKELSIASNMNLLVTDLNGYSALIETYDGICATRMVESSSAASHLTATNHPLCAEVLEAAPRVMNHSMIRFEAIEQIMSREGQLVTRDDLMKLLEAEYPAGLAVHNYDQWFGTLRSILFHLDDRTLDVCFGSPLLNPWHKLKVGERLGAESFEVQLQMKDYGTEFWVQHIQA